MVELKCYVSFRLYNKVIQLYMCLFFLKIFSHLGYYTVLNSDSKESACNSGDTGSIPGLERSSGEGNGNPLQYSCLENPMERGVW